MGGEGKRKTKSTKSEKNHQAGASEGQEARARKRN